MKNFKQTGRSVTLTAPYAVASGGGALVGNLFGVAVNAVANGAQGEFETEGCFELPALASDTFDQGQRLYWDNTNKRLTETATGNYPVGVATAAKVATVALATVRLDGVATAAAA